MKLKSKILLAQSPLGLIILIMCLVFIFTINMIRSSTGDILDQNYKSISALETMRQSLDAVDNSVISILTSTYESKAEIINIIQTSQKDFEYELDFKLKSIPAIKSGGNIDMLSKNWNAYLNKLTKALEKDKPVISEKDYLETLRPSYSLIKENINFIIDLNQDEIFYKTETINDMIMIVGKMVVVFSIFTFLIGILASGVLINKIMQPLSVLTRLVRDISNGKIGLKLDISGNDEVSELGEEFNLMIQSLESYKKTTLGEVVNAKEYLQKSLDTIPDPLFVFSTDFRILNINTSAIQTFNLQSPIIMIEDIEEVVRNRVIEIIDYFKSSIEPTIPRGLSKPLMISKNNISIELIPIAKAIFEAGKGIIGVSILFRNITNFDLKGYIKTERLVTLTHEILSPLNSVQTALHICLEKLIGDLTQKQTEFLHIAREDCGKVRKLVTNLQDIDKIDSIDINFTTEEISLETIILDAVEALEILADNKKITLNKDLTYSVDKIIGNLDHLKLVFKNVIENAINQTPENGEINIRMNETKKDILCLIHNTGSFIPDEYKDKIFDKSFTLENTDESKQGIGLYVSKQILSKHNGRIGVKSSKDFGTTVWIKLPKKS